MSNHNFSIQWRIVLNQLIVIGLLLTALPQASIALPPQPEAPSVVETSITPLPNSHRTPIPPVPGQLSGQAEQARAKAAMDATLSKYLSSQGITAEVDIVDVQIEGEWGYGIVEPPKSVDAFNEPIYLLAHQLSDHSWQTVLPTDLELYLQWLAALPTSLINSATKYTLRKKAIESQKSRSVTKPLSPEPEPTPAATASPTKAEPHDMLDLPGFVLPYESKENGQIRWTGGPHAFGNLNTGETFPSGEGSGLDFAKVGGQDFNVLAMASGTIEYASCGLVAGFGCMIAIRHFTGNSVMVYAHLGGVWVEEGQHVNRGQIIGRAGSTGTDNVHLHIELRDGSSSCSVTGRCLPDGRWGNPIGWDDLVHLVDGYRIGGYLADGDGINSYNYDGSAVKGNVKIVYDFRYNDPGHGNRTDVIARVHSSFTCPVTATDCEINSDPNASEGTQFAGNGIFNATKSRTNEDGGFLLSTNSPPIPTNDTTPPSASGFSASVSGGISNLVTFGVQDNSGGSGVSEVRFSAKWNNVWRGIGTDSTSPYSLNWDMCNSGVPDGDVELGMEVWDNGGNKWVWSEHHSNPHITKSHNCAPPPPAEGVYLFSNTGQGGNSCYVTQDTPSIGNYCGSGWNDNVESTRVQGSYYFALYRDDNYSGGEPITGNFSSDLPSEWRNQASSIRIRRSSPASFSLYDLGDWNGESFPSDRTIHDLGHWRFNDKAESIRVTSGYEVLVCEHANFHGICGRTDHDVSDLNAVAQGLRSGASSVRVCNGNCPSAPNTPALSIPDNGDTVSSSENAVFQWTGNGIEYLVEYWGGGLSGTRNSGWQTGTQWSPGLLSEASAPYYWRVKAWNEYGESGWSQTASFYVQRPQPDLHVYALPGYTGAVVPSSVRDTNSVSSLYAGRPTFLDWHFANSGTGAATGSFNVELWIDDTRYVNYPFTGLDRYAVNGFDDWQETVPSMGWHTIRLVVDPDNAISESDETNNVWESQFYWNPVTGWWGEYFSNQNLSGNPAFVRDDPDINFEWYSDPPHPSLPAEQFSAKWTRTVNFNSGTYQFHVLRDDGARLWIDDTLVLDEWQDGREEHVFEHTMTAGSHALRFEAYENGGWARSGLSWTSSSSNCNDVNEPNDTIATTTLISINDSVSADICPSGDVDFYSFVGSEDDKIVIDIDARILDSYLDSYVYLYDSDGATVLAYNDDDSGTFDSILGFQLPHDGTYYIKVRSYDHPNSGGREYYYNLSLTRDEEAPSSAVIITPINNAWIDPDSQLIEASAEDTGSGISRIEFLWHDSDWENSEWTWLGADHYATPNWTFQFNSADEVEQRGGAFTIWAFDWAGNWIGQVVSGLGIDRTAPEPHLTTRLVYGSAPFRDFLIDFAESSDNLAGINAYDIQWRQNGGSWQFLRENIDWAYMLNFTGENGHTYEFRIRARDYAGNESAYSVPVTHTVQICPISADSFENDDSHTTANWIDIDAPSQLHNIHEEQDSDWVKFSVVPGVIYTLHTQNTGGHADTQIWLYDTDGTTLLRSNDDYYGMGVASRIDWEPETSGVYFARIDHWDDVAYGCTTTYELSISTTSPPLGDVNQDGNVDLFDVQILAEFWNTTRYQEGYDLRFDLNNTGRIDIQDVMFSVSSWNGSNGRAGSRVESVPSTP